MGKFRFLEFENDDDLKQDAESNEFAAMLEEGGEADREAHVHVSKGEKITAPILQVGKESIYLDLGGKLTGVASKEEWIEEPVPTAGSEISLFVKSISGSEVVLTRVLKAESGSEEEWLNAKESGAPIDAKVEKAVNGGFQVKAGTSKAFVPISHMDLGNIEDPESYVGQTLQFQVLEVKEGGKNLLFTRKNLLKSEQEEARTALLREIKEGETRSAVITKLMPFGAFARIGPGTEGLIPLGEMAWKRITKASDVVKEGEEVQVKILSIAHSPKLRIGLTMKDAGTDPWLLASTKLTPGSFMEGKVTRVTDFGAFVEVSDGIEGLVHISQLSWTKRIRHPGDVLRPDEKHSFKILSLNVEDRKLSLSLRGDMPEDMQQNAKKLANRGELSEEEQGFLSAWKDYQSEQKAAPSQPANTGDNSIFAQALKSAKRRKSK